MVVWDLLNITAQIEGIEWIILLIVVAGLFLFGPQKLPELARGFGRAMGEFQRGRMEIEREISHQMQTPAVTVQSREEQTAAALGLTTAGRSQMQLKLDIARAIDKAPDEKVVAAAHALGLANPGTDIPAMREQILKNLTG